MQLAFVRLPLSQKTLLASSGLVKAYKAIYIAQGFGALLLNASLLNSLQSYLERGALDPS